MDTEQSFRRRPLAADHTGRRRTSRHPADRSQLRSRAPNTTAASNWPATPRAKVSISIVWGTNADAVRQIIALGKLGKNLQEIHLLIQGRKLRHGAIRNQRHGHRLLPRRRGFADARRQPQRFAPRRHCCSQESSLRRLSLPRRQFRFRLEWRDAIGDPDKRPPVYRPGLARAATQRHRHR